MKNCATHLKCAENYGKWVEYVCPDFPDTEEEFEAMSIQEKINIQIKYFGEEIYEEEEN